MTTEQTQILNTAIDAAMAALPEGDEYQLNNWIEANAPLPADVNEALVNERVRAMIRECAGELGVTLHPEKSISERLSDPKDPIHALAAAEYKKLTEEELRNGLDPSDPHDAKQLARLEQNYPHAITINLVPCTPDDPARVRIAWGDRNVSLNIDDARDLALKIIGIASTAAGESFDNHTGHKFESRLTQAQLRWKESA